MELKFKFTIIRGASTPFYPPSLLPSSSPQARDRCAEEDNNKFTVSSKQRSASLHDIMDSDTFLGPTAEPHPGVENPLTAMGIFSDFSGSDGDGTERGMSDIEMEEGRVRPGMLYVCTYTHSGSCCDDPFLLRAHSIMTTFSKLSFSR